MEYPTLPQRLIDAIDGRSPDARVQIHKVGDRWVDIPAREMLRRIAGLSHAFAEMGVHEGDRVAIFAPNCPEWHTADFAITGLGAVVVPIYFRESLRNASLTSSAIQERKSHSLLGPEQAARLLSIRSSLANLERIVVADGAAGTQPDDTLQYETLIASANRS